MPNVSVFVCGVTGIQGGATARRLLHSGIGVHAVIRNPYSPEAQVMQSNGVKFWQGDYDQEDILREALSRTTAIFLNFMPDFTDLGANLRQARSILRIAEKGATVRQVVYSSMVGLDQSLHSPAVDRDSVLYQIFESKALIEQAVRSSNVPNWSVLRPSLYMLNYVNPLAAAQVPGLSSSGTWITPIQPMDVLPLVDSTTIGHFFAAALMNPERFKGQTITYADELVTMGEIINKVAGVAGLDLRTVSMTEEDIEQQRKTTNRSLARDLVMRDSHQYVNLEAVKKWGIPLTSFDEFLRREKQAVRETYQKV